MKTLVGMWTMRRLTRNRQLKGCFLLLAIVCIPIVIALVFSDSMMDGVVDRLISFSGGHIRVAGDPDLSEWKSQIKSSEKVIYGYGILYSETNTVEVQMKGVEDSFFDSYRSDAFSIRKTEETSGRSITISSTTAKELKIELGDKLTVMVVPGDASSVIRPVLMTVGAIYDTGYAQIDSALVFIDFTFAELLFSDNIYTELLIEAGDDAETLAADMRTHGIGATSWISMSSAIYDNFEISRQMILIVLSIIVVLSAFYTASVSHQIVNDKNRETYTARLIGATRGIILKVSFLSTMAVVVSAQIVGVTAGVALSYILGPVISLLSHTRLNIFTYYLLDFDVTVPWPSILLLMGIMLVVSALSILISLCGIRTGTVKE